MYIKQQRAINRIAAAYRYAMEHHPVPISDMRHIVFVGPPGSRKNSVLKAIMKYGSATYEKVRIVTNRERYPDERKESHIFTKKPLTQATGLKIIEEMTYAIGTDEYGISLRELTQTIARGKRFILFANIAVAQALRALFPGSIMLVYLDASEEKRQETLSKKFHEILEKIPVKKIPLPDEEGQKTKLLKKVGTLLEFGNQEVARYQALFEKEKEQGQPFTFYYVEHTKMFNPYVAARFILDNAHTFPEDLPQEVALACEA